MAGRAGPGLVRTLRRGVRALRLGEDARRLGRLALRAVTTPPELEAPHGPPGRPDRRLDALLQGDDRRLDLARGLALIAREDAPDLEVERVVEEVEALAAALQARLRRAPPGPEAQLEAANRFVFDQVGFGPSSPRASRTGDDRLVDLLLPAVLRRRRGHCVGLSTAYLAICTRAGLPVFGVSAPGHFFVRWDGPGLRRNVETTARGLAQSDDDYAARYRIARPLVDRGVYLQSLRRREVLVEVLNNRANFFWDRGDDARALRDLDRVVLVSRGFLRAWVGRGFAALRRGHLDVALHDLGRALELDPDDPRALLLMGEVRLRQGDLEAAERALRRVVDGDGPSSALGCTNLGRVFARRGAWEEAVRWHDEALRIDPSCHVAWNNLGVARRALGLEPEAASAFGRAAELAPEFLPARENLLALRRRDGRLPWSAWPAARAVRRAHAARVARAPRDDAARAAYVRHLLDLGDLEAALGVAREGAAARDAVPALETLALAARRAGRAQEALAALEEALALDRARGGLETARLERQRAAIEAGEPGADRPEDRPA